MNAKSFLAVLLGAITHFVLGFLIYALLLAGFFESNIIVYEGLMVNGNEAMPGYALSSILFATFITYILQKTGNITSRSAIVTGAVATLLIGASINVVLYFSLNLATGLYYVVDTIAFTVMGSLVALVASLMLSRSKAPSPTGAPVA